MMASDSTTSQSDERSSVWWRRTRFPAFAVSRFISQTGDMAAITALTVHVYAVTDSGLAVGALFVARVLPRILGLFAGAIGDRTELRRLMITCDLVCGVVFLGIAVAAAGYLPLLALVFVAECATHRRTARLAHDDRPGGVRRARAPLRRVSRTLGEVDLTQWRTAHLGDAWPGRHGSGWESPAPTEVCKAQGHAEHVRDVEPRSGSFCLVWRPRSDRRHRRGRTTSPRLPSTEMISGCVSTRPVRFCRNPSAGPRPLCTPRFRSRHPGRAGLRPPFPEWPRS